jgi:threonine dehydrogenase-like Zn-dependent dehydrogenase
MQAFLVREPGAYAVEKVSEASPGPGEVAVTVVAVGICGSDLELLDGRRPAAYVRYPVVVGCVNAFMQLAGTHAGVRQAGLASVCGRAGPRW